MTQEIKTIDDLFDLIDNELIILSEAKQKGKYKWFDFVAALRVLDDRIQNAEYNKYRSRKVSNLIKVLNDLYYTPVQTCCKRILSYDKERKIATSEWHISGKDARVELVENEVPFQKQAHYDIFREQKFLNIFGKSGIFICSVNNRRSFAVFLMRMWIWMKTRLLSKNISCS